MRIESVELRRIHLPLVSPFRTSFGVQHDREVLLVRVRTATVEGWGECVAMGDPLYSSEYLGAAQEVLRLFLIPPLLTAERLTAARVEPLLAAIKGHRMAKAALEMAVLDAETREHDQSLADHLGAVVDHVPSGVSVGIMDSIPELVDAVAGYLDAGYVRIKLKIEPGWDVEPVRVVRERFGDDVLLQVDANTAYTLGDAPLLARLDPFDLLLIEQPLPEEDILGHAELARRIHDVCLAHGVPVWCGGMLETGLGRAANVALAALPGFTLPGDVSASDRFYRTDITEPFVLRDGGLDVPTGPGLGVAPIPELLAEMTTGSQDVTR